MLVTGQFQGTAQFDASTSVTSLFNPNTNGPSFDIFVAKYQNNGTFTWVETGKAPYTDRGMDVGSDVNGNVYMVGQFSDTITFDQTHNNNMYNAICLVKYDANGNEQWMQRIGGSASNVGMITSA